jgi:hypothetical protein
MQINLTKKQYWDLMRATYMADWMANAICEQGMKEDAEIKAIRNHIFSFAKEMGYEKYVDYSEDMNTYFATFAMDDEPSTRKLIKRYDEHTVWETLIDWLGDRDFFRKYKKDEIKKMGDIERFTKRMECEEVWGEEFEKNGVERIQV